MLRGGLTCSSPQAPDLVPATETTRVIDSRGTQRYDIISPGLSLSQRAWSRSDAGLAHLGPAVNNPQEVWPLESQGLPGCGFTPSGLGSTYRRAICPHAKLSTTSCFNSSSDLCCCCRLIPALLTSQPEVQPHPTGGVGATSFLPGHLCLAASCPWPHLPPHPGASQGELDAPVPPTEPRKPPRNLMATSLPLPWVRSWFVVGAQLPHHAQLHTHLQDQGRGSQL